MTMFLDIHGQHPGGCESVQDVQHIWTGHGQEVPGPSDRLPAPVSTDL